MRDGARARDRVRKKVKVRRRRHLWGFRRGGVACLDKAIRGSELVVGGRRLGLGRLRSRSHRGGGVVVLEGEVILLFHSYGLGIRVGGWMDGSSIFLVAYIYCT